MCVAPLQMLHVCFGTKPLGYKHAPLPDRRGSRGARCTRQPPLTYGVVQMDDLLGASKLEGKVH